MELLFSLPSNDSPHLNSEDTPYVLISMYFHIWESIYKNQARYLSSVFCVNICTKLVVTMKDDGLECI